MEFRHPTAVAAQKNHAISYLTNNLSNTELGRSTVEMLIDELGNCVEAYPDWHPIFTLPSGSGKSNNFYIGLPVYYGMDHTSLFVKGFVTCPYSEDAANNLVASINAVQGLQARRLDVPLYSDNAYPVVVKATNIILEGDGTIRSRDAIRWCIEDLVLKAEKAEVAETWWNIRESLLGRPNGARSSILVNQHTGNHIKKILETLNNSGIYGPIKEWSLEMLSHRKRELIYKNLIFTAVDNYNARKEENFTFELRGETCNTNVRHNIEDKELYIEIEIGDSDLFVKGYYELQTQSLNCIQLNGKRSVAEKFL